jgi:predicted GNAT family N-acyltransferase
MFYGGYSMRIEWIKGTEGLENGYYIRRKVFIEEQDVPEELEVDEFDRIAEHVVVYIEEKTVATGRLVNIEGEDLLGRIAVLKELRGKGLGKVVVENLIKRAGEKGLEEIHLHAQLTAQKFYEKLGFHAYGEIFDDAGIDHISMLKIINNIL